MNLLTDGRGLILVGEHLGERCTWQCVSLWISERPERTRMVSLPGEMESMSIICLFVCLFVCRGL
jgi:hypothetical protein